MIPREIRRRGEAFLFRVLLGKSNVNIVDLHVDPGMVTLRDVLLVIFG